MASAAASPALPPTDPASSPAASPTANSGDAGLRRDAIFDASPFGALTGAIAAALRHAADLEALTVGKVLSLEGEPARALFVIGSGRVRVERRRSTGPGSTAAVSGPRFAVAHRGPGELVGEPALVTGAATEMAVVADAGDALAFHLTPLRRLAASEPGVRDAIAAALVTQHRVAQRRLESLLLHGVEVRLARLLVDAAGRWGTPSAQGQLILAGFTHADLAVLIGSTRETVTLLLGKLRRNGLVAFERRRIVIRDRAGLERLAAADG
jgi:CRP/FNR family transcriptional regulator, cyclic AMP receptor protein